MKKLIMLALLIAAATVINCRSALAQDLGNGAQVFSANCAACHAGGRNVVNAAKTLKKDALEKYDMYSMENIKQQIYNGKNAMPSFRGRLTDEQIENVAAYVLSQADKGW
ncbi:MAG: cytochrome c6 PetJ [Cyanophyceae cyanobacterium]